MGKTSIAWTEQTWNPLRGCSRVSEGCRNCYAEKMAARFAGPGGPYEGTVTDKGRWNGTVKLVMEHLGDPLRWTKPRLVFVNSMSDLFHDDVSNEFIAAVFGVMAASPRHTFQVLTKRPERMRAWFEWITALPTPPTYTCSYFAFKFATDVKTAVAVGPAQDATYVAGPWPLVNVWLGVSVEDQRAADTRIPLLLSTPAAVRWISAEPLLGLLGPVDLSAYLAPAPGGTPALDWVVVGGESGPGARPCDVGAIRSIVAQCKAAGASCFVKQLGADPYNFGRCVDLPRHPKGGDPAEWPEDLRVREWPEAK